jgi:hypothetical protein
VHSLPAALQKRALGPGEHVRYPPQRALETESEADSEAEAEPEPEAEAEAESKAGSAAESAKTQHA